MNNTSNADTICLQNVNTPEETIYSNDCSTNKDKKDSVVFGKLNDLNEIETELESFKNNSVAINKASLIKINI